MNPLLMRALGVLIPVLLGIGLFTALMYFVYSAGAESVQAKWDAEKKHFAAEQAKAEQRDQVIVTETVYKYLESKPKIVTKEVPIYVTKEADTRCEFTRGFVELHDAAAAGRLPVPPVAGSVNDPAEGLEPSDVGRTVAGNYAVCNDAIAKLNAILDIEEARNAARSTDSNRITSGVRSTVDGG